MNDDQLEKLIIKAGVIVCVIIVSTLTLSAVILMLKEIWIEILQH